MSWFDPDQRTMVPMSNIVNEVIKNKINSGGLLQARLWDWNHGDVDYEAEY